MAKKLTFCKNLTNNKIKEFESKIDALKQFNSGTRLDDKPVANFISGKSNSGVYILSTNKDDFDNRELIDEALKKSEILVVFDLMNTKQIYQIDKHINNIESEHSISRVVNIDKDAITAMVSKKYSRPCGITTFYNYYNNFENKDVSYWKVNFKYYKLVHNNITIGYFNKKIDLEVYSKNNNLKNYKIEKIENDLSKDTDLNNIFLKHKFNIKKETDNISANDINSSFVKNISEISNNDSLINGIIKLCNNCINMMINKPELRNELKYYTAIKNKFEKL